MRQSWVLGFGLLAACGDTYLTYEVVGNRADDGGLLTADDAGQTAADAAQSRIVPDATHPTTDASTPDSSLPEVGDGSAADSSAGDAAADAVIGDSNEGDASGLDAAASDGGRPDVVFSFDAGGSVDAAACAQTAVEAKPLGIDLYVVLDKSGSMHGPVSTWQAAKGDCNVGQTVNSKWCKSINALANYFSAPNPNGNRAALNFFSGTFTDAQCGGSLYSTPQVPVVGFVPLPDTNAFVSAMNAQAPGGETPTEAALRGIVIYTSNASTYTAGRQRVGVLVTDGYPTSCEASASKLAAIADTHFKSTAVPIFMVGMDGADFSHLETMAAGGHAAMHAKKVGGLTNACGNGKSQCQSWNVGDGSNNALAVALEQIQYEAAACSFAMPETDAGIIDPGTVNAEYLQSGTTPKALSRVTNAASCTSSGGFYFDNNASPTTIKLCSTTCDVVRADAKAKVQVKLGCEGS